MSLLQKSLIHAHFFLFKLTLKCKNTDFPFRALFTVINDLRKAATDGWECYVQAAQRENIQRIKYV